MSMNCDITIIPGRRVADLLAAGAGDRGETTIEEAMRGLGVAALDVGDSIVLISSLQLAGALPGLAAGLGAPVYQALIGETGDGFAFMGVTEAGARTRAFTDGVEVQTEGAALAVENTAAPLDTEALMELLARVEPALDLDDLRDRPARDVDIESLTELDPDG